MGKIFAGRYTSSNKSVEVACTHFCQGFDLDEEVGLRITTRRILSLLHVFNEKRVLWRIGPSTYRSQRSPDIEEDGQY